MEFIVRGFLRSNTFKILLIVVLIMSAVLILSITVGSTPLGSFFGFVTAPMQQVSAELTKDEQQKVSNMSRAELEKYCATLSAENTQLRSQVIDYFELQQKNRQYQEALKIKEKNLDLELEVASVIGRDATDAFGGFSIDLGYVDGIEVGDPVITEKGVVGVMSQVYATSGKVTTILSEDVKMGAISKEFMENGVVTGSIETAATGSVRLNYLTKDSKIQHGTIITTSGSGGIFPQDLVIGRVSFLGSSQKDVSLYAVVEPYESIATVSDVFVITNFPGKDEILPLPNTSGEASS